MLDKVFSAVSRLQRKVITGPHQLQPLNGIRGVALLMVMERHAWAWAGSPELPIAGGRINLNFPMFGVSLFFVLSGYLLFSQYVDRHLRRVPHPPYRTFVERRLRRLVPGYYVLLFVFFFVIPPASKLFRLDVLDGWRNLAAHVVFLHNIDTEVASALFAVWALAVEMQFYLLLPLVAHLTLNGPGWRQRVVVAWLLSVGLYALSFFNVISFPTVHVSLVQHGNEFLAGCVVAVFVSSVRDHRRFKSLSKPFSIVCFLLGAASIVLLGNFTRGTLGKLHTPYPLYGLAYALLILGAVNAEGWLRRLLSNHALVFIGIIGYGMFLWHGPIGSNISAWSFVREINRPFVRLPVILGLDLLLSLPIGYVSYVFIESPFLTRRHETRALASSGVLLDKN